MNPKGILMATEDTSLDLALALREHAEVVGGDAARLMVRAAIRLEESGSERDRLTAIVETARELISPAGMVNRGVDRGLVVVEKADKSDPHYRLCSLLSSIRSPKP